MCSNFQCQWKLFYIYLDCKQTYFSWICLSFWFEFIYDIPFNININLHANIVQFIAMQHTLSLIYYSNPLIIWRFPHIGICLLLSDKAQHVTRHDMLNHNSRRLASPCDTVGQCGGHPDLTSSLSSACSVCRDKNMPTYYVK